MLNTDNNLYDIYLIYVENILVKHKFFSAIICKINNELPNGQLKSRLAKILIFRTVEYLKIQGR